MATEQNSLPPFDASPQLSELFRFALAHGVELIRRQGNLIPMVISVLNGKHSMAVLTEPAKNPELLAKKSVAALPSGTVMYVVMLQGKLSVGADAKWHDAVIVVGAERSKSYGYRLGQAYTRHLLRGVTAIDFMLNNVSILSLSKDTLILPHSSTSSECFKSYFA